MTTIDIVLLTVTGLLVLAVIYRIMKDVNELKPHIMHTVYVDPTRTYRKSSMPPVYIDKEVINQFPSISLKDIFEANR